ncbi:unnamed protein product [Pipistrellus nathusii]|uniref:Uncharacterized protein n=1 Tax=Pipistrellus nathusii TaxID=59473 RepID=A0ABP0A039_PIPNA
MFHPASAFSCARELPPLPQIPLKKQIQLHGFLLNNRGHPAGLQSRAQLGPELEGQPGAAKLTPSKGAAGSLSICWGDHCQKDGLGTTGHPGSRWAAGTPNCREFCCTRRTIAATVEQGSTLIADG